MSVKSKGYADAAFKLIAFLAVLDAVASIIGNTGFAVTLSVVIGVLAIGVVWERRRA
ncbi:hypothetical protein V7795_21500 [Rhizobium laguerreae]|uniref:hypothetical protein n=1 Tax=Rhizobium laguerreae TaxID=1076926 RepID=UPI00300089DB